MITKNASLLKKAPSLIYKAAAQLYIDKEFPRHLFIEVCAQCNLKCEYCPRENNRGNMPFDMFTAIIDEASNYGPRSFSLHLFNEPFLYPKIFEAIEYIKKKNKKHTVLITSNGTLFEHLVDKIVKSPMDKLIWSWRHEAKFSSETKENLRRWGKLTVRMIKGVTPERAFEEWRDWKNKEVREIHNYGGNVDIERFGVKNTVGSRYPCYHLWLAPAVAWNGKILLCCSDPHQREVIGTFPTDSISTAWTRFDKVREAHLRGEYEGICKDCDVWKSYPDLFFKFQKGKK